MVRKLMTEIVKSKAKTTSVNATAQNGVCVRICYDFVYILYMCFVYVLLIFCHDWPKEEPMYDCNSGENAENKKDGRKEQKKYNVKCCWCLEMIFYGRNFVWFLISVNLNKHRKPVYITIVSWNSKWLTVRSSV